LQWIEMKRRTPRQARSRATVDVIFEAVARIIEAGDEARLTTNRIAETAGIAIGTLYGYFPNREAILLAMARRELARVQASIEAIIAADETGRDVYAEALRAALRGFGGQDRVRRALLETMVAQGHYVELTQPAQRIGELILARGALPGRAAALSDIQSFVLTRAIAGVIRAAGFEDSPHVASGALERELLHMVRGYLAQSQQGG
jgi:AcrR family transcriptional regulator